MGEATLGPRSQAITCGDVKCVVGDFCVDCKGAQARQ